jgi:hypothetical protein
MVYLVTQLTLGLFIAAVLGFGTGFLLCRWLLAGGAAELKENYRAKLLNANRKLEILRLEASSEAAKAQAAAQTEQELRFVLAELQKKYALAEQQLSTQSASNTGLAKLADRIAELERTLSGRNAKLDQSGKL